MYDYIIAQYGKIKTSYFNSNNCFFFIVSGMSVAVLSNLYFDRLKASKDRQIDEF